jgi:hypothetical protein
MGVNVMKAIINGLRFDTEKATLVGESSANCSRSDFSYWEAGLYRTPRSGRFFLAGFGGAMTMFARSVDNGRTGGSGIRPMDIEDAREWAERYLTTAEVEAGFADAIQDA